MGRCDARTRVLERHFRCCSESRRPRGRSSILGRIVHRGSVWGSRGTRVAIEGGSVGCKHRSEPHSRLSRRLAVLEQPASPELHGPRSMKQPTPKSAGYRMPAEWEPQEAIWL